MRQYFLISTNYTDLRVAGNIRKDKIKIRSIAIRKVKIKESHSFQMIQLPA